MMEGSLLTVFNLCHLCLEIALLVVGAEYSVPEGNFGAKKSWQVSCHRNKARKIASTFPSTVSTLVRFVKWDFFTHST